MVQIIITELAQSPRSYDELKSLIQAENASVKSQITSELQQHRRHLVHDQYCQRFLESLYYPEILSRQETVVEAHRKTFQWIYEPDGFDKSAHPWDSVVQWFEHGGGIYWISGKAGSGKSTLMNYLCQHDRTLNLLRAWSGMKEVFTPSFFFWNAGTTLEKSTEGLLRSLLYQTLQRFPKLNPLSYDEKSALGSAEDSQERFGQVVAWTEGRLRRTFQKVIRQAQENCRICIFIDGLDEISGEPDTVIEVIKTLLSADLKVCLSSRPDQLYADAFDSYAMLRLHDLTGPDIRTYVWDRLQSHSPINSQPDVSFVVDSIALKAQGVFLWVDLVVKAMIKGLRNHDSLEQLQRRVDSTPSDVEALYARMLGKIEVAHRKEAALLFSMALADTSQSLLNLTFALCKESYRVPLKSVQDVLSSSRRILERIPTICAGLLEVHSRDQDNNYCGVYAIGGHVTFSYALTASLEAADLNYYERYVFAAFIHRTAIDYFRYNKHGQAFLKENTESCPSPHSIYVRALLAKVELLGFPRSTDASSKISEKEVGRDVDVTPRMFVYTIMQAIFVEEWETATAQISLCDDVDRTLSTVFQQHWGTSPLSHWITRWRSLDWLAFKFPPFVSDIRKRPRSSSSDSFQSARSEPTILSNVPVDFLGLAASSGLSRYVHEKIEEHPNHFDQGYMNYLLYCPMWTFVFDEHRPLKSYLGAMKLMDELLSRGGNPNVYIRDSFTTIWGVFLTCLDGLDKFRSQNALATTAKAFIKAGANVHAKAARICSYGPMQLTASSEQNVMMRFDVEISALTIVRRLIKHAPEWKTVEANILARGGCESRRCTDATATICLMGEAKMPERQVEEFVTSLNTAYEIYSGQPNPNIDWQDLEEKTCKEFAVAIEDPDNRICSDDDMSSVDDTKEEYYGPQDSQPV